MERPTHGIVQPPTFALAPMEGVTDDVVRSIFGTLGGLDACVSEFVRVSGEPASAKVLLREVPELRDGARTDGGVPVHVQLLGGDPGRMAESAATAVSLGALAIDLNFGCPAPTVNRHDGGASLLRDPRRVEAMTRAVRDALPSRVPVSAKIRLGWSDPDDVVVLARAAEAGGAAWITVHGRTRAQGYAPPADWDRIGRAREAVSIPVVANGDLRTPEDVRRCHERSGCTHFMFGRGAIERPEIFRVLRGIDAGFWSASRRLALIERYAALSLERAPERTHGTLCRVKQWLRSMSNAEPALVPCFDAVKRVEHIAPARDLLSLAVERLDAGTEPMRASA